MRIQEVSAQPLRMPANPLKPILVCFSHLRWSFVWQRPQHLLSRAARTYRVVFVEDPLIAPDGEPRLDLSHGPGAVTVAVPVLPEALGPEQRKAARRMLVDDLLESMGGSVAVSWFYTPMALEIYGHVESEVCVYDCMDELTGFRGAPPELRRYETALFRRADVVFTGGRSLYEAKRGRHANVHCFPSSIDAAHFRQARRPTAPEPADQSGIGQPRIGFFGVIDERMDMDVLAGIADLKPDWQFVLIGPVVKIDAADLPRRPNIHWLGSKRYQELPAYLSRWDLGFMPFAINEATRYISPTKTPEFLAAGLPVVSTPVADVARTYGKDGLVEIAAGAHEVAAKAALLLRRRRGRWLARVDRRLARMSWDTTWREMSEEIERARGRPSAAGLPVARRAAASAGEVSRV